MTSGNATLDVHNDNHVTWVWIPHAAIALVFITFLATDFYFYHKRNRQRYRRKRDEYQTREQMLERRHVLQRVKLRYMHMDDDDDYGPEMFHAEHGNTVSDVTVCQHEPTHDTVLQNSNNINQFTEIKIENCNSASCDYTSDENDVSPCNNVTNLINNPSYDMNALSATPFNVEEDLSSGEILNYFQNGEIRNSVSYDVICSREVMSIHDISRNMRLSTSFDYSRTPYGNMFPPYQDDENVY